MKFWDNSSTDVAIRAIARAGRPLSTREIRQAEPVLLAIDRVRGLNPLLAERVKYGELAIQLTRSGRRKWRIAKKTRVLTEVKRRP